MLLLAGGALVAVAAAWLFGADPRGISLGGVELGGEERAWLADRSVDFMEDLQFKDFNKAATYHLEATQKARDVPALIRRIFRIPPELLDIQSYKVLEVDLDRSKTRARVRMLTYYHSLGDETGRDQPDSNRSVEVLLYWFRGADQKWTMELESSLR
jgi:hypothetical protein